MNQQSILSEAWEPEEYRFYETWEGFDYEWRLAQISMISQGKSEYWLKHPDTMPQLT